MDYEKYLTNLGPLGLTFALVIALGYIVRIIPVIQNKFIPLFAVIAGAVLLPLIAPMGYVGEQWKNPTVVLAIYGFIVGVAAWAAHALIIARIEDFISSKVPAVGKLLNNTSDNPKPPNVTLWLLTGLLAIGTMACATRWIDKVAQTRAATAKVGYRAVSEFNGWYQQRTNELRGTTPKLEIQRTAVYTLSSNLSASLLTLEAVEYNYRLAPTNQTPVVSAAQAVASQSSNLVYLVTTIRKGNAP